MKKYLQILFFMALASLLLVACGTAEEPKDDLAPDNMTADSEKEGTDTEDNEVTTDGETPSEGNEDSITAENALTYTSKGKEYTSETILIDEANYTIRILEGYEFTQEEPGKDLIFLQENGSISARIEVISKNDSTFEKLVANTEELMAAVNEQFKPFDINDAVKDYPEIGNFVAYIATYEGNEEVVGVVFEKDDILVRLTVFDDKEFDLKDALIKMGLTIEGN